MGKRLIGEMSSGAALTVAMALVFGTACADEKSAAQYAEEQAKKARKERSESSPPPAEIEVPVKGGKHIDCNDLLTDITAFSEALPHPVRLRQLNERQQRKRKPGINAICELVREGEPPSAEEQKKMSEKTLRLGTLPGGVYCEIRVDCGQPDPKDFESACRQMPQHEGNRDLGIFACVMQSQRAERDAYRFKFYEPDTGCYLDVLGGATVVGMEIPTACSKLAMEQISGVSIVKYKE